MTPRPSLIALYGEQLAEREGGFYCHYCAREVKRWNTNVPFRATVDHKTPVSKGGKTVLSNLVLCCYACNQEKGTRPYLKMFRKKAEVRIRRNVNRGIRKINSRNGAGGE